MGRKVLLFFILALCLTGILSIFWYQELQYNLPTQIPANYKKVALSTKVALANSSQLKGPVFLHFYNPDCPCSRFNATHLKQLIRDHGDSIRFIILVPTKQDIESAKAKFGEDIEYKTDETGMIAKACGVYSTPQAVILDKENLLYFRGNYNKSRYCTNQASNYAELALVSFLNNQPSPAFGLQAGLAYGCELEDQTNTIAEIF